jgi:hypothetical protein
MRDDLDHTLTEHEGRLHQMNESYSTLRERERELLEAREVLRSTKGFFEKVKRIHGNGVLVTNTSTGRYPDH